MVNTIPYQIPVYCSTRVNRLISYFYKIKANTVLTNRESISIIKAKNLDLSYRYQFFILEEIIKFSIIIYIQCITKLQNNSFGLDYQIHKKVITYFSYYYLYLSIILLVNKYDRYSIDSKNIITRVQNNEIIIILF